MGAPMAGHLSNAGLPVAVYNRSQTKTQQWLQDHAGNTANSPALAAAHCEFVLLCVGNDDAVRQICLGEDGVIAHMQAGSTLIDHSTVSATLAMELDTTCKKHGLRFLDAPVSGGQDGAINGQLTIMVGGDAQTFQHAKPVMQHYARAITHMGPAGNGQLTKMVNQICVAGLLQGLAEGLAFSEQAGLDSHKVLEVLSKGAAQSWQMEHRGHTMVNGQFDFGFAVDWMVKDLGLCLDAAEQQHLNLPQTAIIKQYYQQLQKQGKGRLDTSSLIKLLAPVT